MASSFAAAILGGDDPGMQGLKEAIDGEDTLGIVVRCHLYVEEALNQLLACVIPRYRTTDRLQFSRKLDLAYELTLIDEPLHSALRALATLRNKYSHKLNYTLTNNDVAPICAAMPNWATHLEGGVLEKHSGLDLPDEDSKLALAILAMRHELLAMREALEVDLATATQHAKQELLKRESEDESAVLRVVHLFKHYAVKGPTADTVNTD